MKNEENKKQIEDLLKEELKKDRSKTQVEGFTKLDLMELTRKHICSQRDQGDGPKNPQFQGLRDGPQKNKKDVAKEMSKMRHWKGLN